MARVRDVAVRLRRHKPDVGPLPANVCRAPFTSMYLDQHGSIRACCQNTEHPLGNIAEQRLRDIWESDAAKVLRDAMLAQDLDHGCQFCKWQVDEGNDALVFARTFDHLQAESTAPTWPRQVELSMSNACNLQCVMCNGDWSSAIRANREGRPPLPQVYDEQFFEDFRPFLEHVEVVKILGGEPFLGKESLRVMEMLVEMGSTAEVHVTTNGTQWSPRVERILEKLPMTIVVSLDGIDKAGYEAIRIGSDLDVVLENIERFRGYAASHGTTVNLAHCLMTSNWRDFPDFLRYAEDRQLRSYVNTVTHPNSLSLFHLSRTRLQEIVDTYEAADASLQQELKLNRSLWNDQLDRLRHRLAGLQEGKGVDYYLGVAGFPLIDEHAPTHAARRAAADLAGDSWAGLGTDLDLVVRSVLDAGSQVADVDISGLEGKALDSVQRRLEERYGAADIFVPPNEPEDVRAFDMTFTDPLGPRISAFLGPVRDHDGVIESFEAHFVVVSTPDPEEPAGPTADDLLEEFQAAHPAIHHFTIGPDGRIGDVVAGSDDALGRALTEADGTLADELPGALEGVLGSMLDVETSSTEAAGVSGYRIRFAGREPDGGRWLEALTVSTAQRPDGPASSTVHLAVSEPAGV